MVLACRDTASAVRIDLIFSFSPYAREAIARSVPVTLGGEEVRFAAAEDLVVHKVLAGRSRDLDDVRTILLKTQAFDGRRARQTLRDLGRALDRGDELSERFEALWRQTLRDP